MPLVNSSGKNNTPTAKSSLQLPSFGIVITADISDWLLVVGTSQLLADPQLICANGTVRALLSPKNEKEHRSAR